MSWITSRIMVSVTAIMSHHDLEAVPTRSLPREVTSRHLRRFIDRTTGPLPGMVIKRKFVCVPRNVVVASLAL